MLNRKKTIKVLTVMAAFTGVAAVAHPIDVDAAISAKNSVTKAEKLAVELKKEINYGARKKANPKTAVGLPNEKLYKQVKTAYNKALAETKKTKNTKERKVLQTRLAQNVKPAIERTDKYREAVQMGISLNSTSNILNQRVQAANLNEKTIKQYDQASKLKKLDKQIKSVYGKTTRLALTKAYSDTAKFSLSFKSDTDKFVNSFNNEDYAKAITYYTSLNHLLSENEIHKYVDTSSELYKKLYAAYSSTLDNYHALGKLYVAISKSAADPTLRGGKTPEKILSYKKNVTIAAGEARYFKLRNAKIEGNLNIIGVNKGAGTVTLENVKVSKLKNNGGQIIVKDVAEKSLHLNGITANDLIVNDVNGSKIVAGEGSEIANLLVSDQAGGNVNLQSSTGDAFGTINLNSNQSKAINFAGKFDKSNVVVTGKEQKLNFASGTKINELTLKAGAAITAAEGVEIGKINIDPAKKGEIITISGDLKDTVIVIKDANAIIKIAENTVVGEIKVDPSVKEEVTIENKGTINKVDESIVIEGNPVTPGVPAEPTPPGGGGEGGGTTPPESNLPAELLKVTANVGGEVDMVDNLIDLKGKKNNQMFTELNITSKNATEFVLTNIEARGSKVNLIGSTPLEYKITDKTSLSVNELLGSHDKGNDGISMGNMRALFADKPIIIKGYLSIDGKGKQKVEIKINLGVGNDLSTTYSNDYVTITKNGIQKNGKHKATVAINKAMFGKTIGDIDKSAGGVKFIDLALSYIGEDITTDHEFINKLLKNTNKEFIESVTLGQLALLGTIESPKYKIEFTTR